MQGLGVGAGGTQQGQLVSKGTERGRGVAPRGQGGPAHSELVIQTSTSNGGRRRQTEADGLNTGPRGDL